MQSTSKTATHTMHLPKQLSRRRRVWILSIAVLLPTALAAYFGAMLLLTDTRRKIVNVDVTFVLPIQASEAAPRTQQSDPLVTPVVNGFSNPNLILYDEAYIRSYVESSTSDRIVCGTGVYVVELESGEMVTLYGSLDESYLGKRFQHSSLIQFLDSRVNASRATKHFTVPVSVPRELAPNRMNKVELSPWDRDTISVMRLLAEAKSQASHPFLLALIEVPNPWVRSEAIRLLPSTGELGRKTLMELLQSDRPKVRLEAINALLLATPEDPGPGLLMALRHVDPAIREAGKRSMGNLLGSGGKLSKSDLEAMVNERLLDKIEGLQSMIEMAMQDPLAVDATHQ